MQLLPYLLTLISSGVTQFYATGFTVDDADLDPIGNNLLGYGSSMFRLLLQTLGGKILVALLAFGLIGRMVSLFLKRKH